MGHRGWWTLLLRAHGSGPTRFEAKGVGLREDYIGINAG